MSAKIVVETEDKQLGIALGVIIAKAIADAGFENAKAKTVMMVAKLHNKAATTSRSNVLIDDTQGTREPPELRNLQYSIFSNQEEVLAEMFKASPSLLESPVVLDFLPYTDDAYEDEVKKHLG